MARLLHADRLDGHEQRSDDSSMISPSPAANNNSCWVYIYGPSLGQHDPMQACRALGPCWAYILGCEHDLVWPECNSC